MKWETIEEIVKEGKEGETKTIVEENEDKRKKEKRKKEKERKKERKTKENMTLSRKMS